MSAFPSGLRRFAAGMLFIAFALPALAWNSQPTNVSFSNSDGLIIPGKLFYPAMSTGQAVPAVVMLHGCSGIYSTTSTTSPPPIANIYREWADRLTAAGYLALLVDSFTPRGAPNQCGNGPGVGVSEIFDRPKDAVAARNYLASASLGVDPARIGVIGWSNGGSTVMSTLAITDPVDGITPSRLASGHPFAVGIIFYGPAGLSDYRCGTQSNGSPAACWKGLTKSVWASYAPLFFHNGTVDTVALIDYVNTRINRALYQAGCATLSLTAYNNAQHSFDDPSKGGGTCSTTDPNACAKKQADPAVMNTLAQFLKY